MSISLELTVVKKLSKFAFVIWKFVIDRSMNFIAHMIFLQQLKMSVADDWQVEMDRMLGIFEQQSESTLRKINRFFEVMNRPFDVEFKTRFLTQSMQRYQNWAKTAWSHMALESKIIDVCLVRFGLDWNQVSPKLKWSDGIMIKSKATTRNKNLTIAKTHRILVHQAVAEESWWTCDCVSTWQPHPCPAYRWILNAKDFNFYVLFVLFVCPAKIEGHHLDTMENDDVIEILDSSDEDDDVQLYRPNGLDNRKTIQKNINGTHKTNGETISMGGSTVRSKTNSTKESNHKRIASNLMKSGNSSNGLVVMNQQRKRNEHDKAKSTPQNDAHTSLVQLNGNAVMDRSSSENGISTQQLNSSSPNIHQDAVESHGFAAQHKRGLKCHKRINGKWIEIQIDSNGLYHCTYCIRQFKNLHDLSLHMTKSHKNDQYLYDCVRCLLQFGEKAERDRHESQCKGQHYQCHLCKVYVTTLKSNMQVHMRMHSGVKPFRCRVCNKSFQTNSFLRYHLNFIHSRMNPWTWALIV